MFKAVISSILLLAFIWTTAGNMRLKTTTHKIKSDKTAGTFRILQISDFHSCKRMCRKVIDAVKKQCPDAVVITGDFIDGGEKDFSLQREILSSMPKDVPVFFVLGNHEAGAKAKDRFLETMKQEGAVSAGRQGIALGGGIYLYGAEDPREKTDIYEEEMFCLEKEIGGIGPEAGAYNILLSHRPEGFDYAGEKFDLVLAGHAHGGQIRIPLLGGLFAPGQGWLPKYSAGVYKRGAALMLVSRGIGDSSFPFRLNNTPEVVVIEIEAT